MQQKYATCKHLCESASYGYKKKYRWWPFVDIGRRFILIFFWNIYSTNSVSPNKNKYIFVSYCF